MSLAYFPMFPSDFDADTGHLTFAEDGAYNRLLRLSWRCPEAKMPDDLDWICRKARAFAPEDRALIEAILTEFFTRKSGKVFSRRLSEEWTKAHEAHTKRILAGSQGGKAKALKNKGSAPSNAIAKPYQQPEPEPEPDTEEDSIATQHYLPAQAQAEILPPMPADVDKLYDDVLGAVGLARRGVVPHGWMGPFAAVHIVRWRGLGLSDEQIVSVAAHSRSRHADPPNSPKALDASMRTMAAAIQNPQPDLPQGGFHDARRLAPPDLAKLERRRRIDEAAIRGTT